MAPASHSTLGGTMHEGTLMLLWHELPCIQKLQSTLIVCMIWQLRRQSGGIWMRTCCWLLLFVNPIYSFTVAAPSSTCFGVFTFLYLISMKHIKRSLCHIIMRIYTSKTENLPTCEIVIGAWNLKNIYIVKILAHTVMCDKSGCTINLTG